MIQKIINKLLEPRHFWRTVGFDELSEIYASQFLRSFGTSLIGIFVPIYLYKLGFSIPALCLMFVVWALIKIPSAFLVAKTIGKYGPKHTIAISVLLQIVFLGLLMTIDSLNWQLWVIAVFGSLSMISYMMALQVDFSKIKHTEHGGKELSYMQIFERVGAVAGPLIGGIIATLFDPRYSIALAIVILCASLIPIFLSTEPIRQNQVIIIKGFPWRRNKRNIRISAVFAIENAISVTVWPLFLGAFILIENTYAVLGILTAVSTAFALLVVYVIGKLIDDRKGGLLLNVGAIGNAILHLFRPFVGSVSQALAINLMNEPLTAMYRMPFLKGRFDDADNVPGYRIVYFMIIEFHIAIAASIFWLSMFVIATSWSDKGALQVAFVVGAVMSLIITKQKFSALK